MAESATHLVDEVVPARPVLRCVPSVPHPLRFPFAHDSEATGAALGVVHRCLITHLIGRAGLPRKEAHIGAVTPIRRFGGTLNLNVRFHKFLLDGVCVERADARGRSPGADRPSPPGTAGARSADDLRIQGDTFTDGRSLALDGRQDRTGAGLRLGIGV